ncbi:carbon-nitrogen hydrolase family protein [bacterium]|nr:carbon-nitrogen hydrolase family protein [bacterium]
MADLLDLVAWIFERYDESPDSGAASECGISPENQKLFREDIGRLDPENPDAEVAQRFKKAIENTRFKRKASHWFLKELHDAKGQSYLYLFRQRAWLESGENYLLTVGSGDLVPAFGLDLKAMGVKHPTTRTRDVGIRRLPNNLPFKIELNFAWTDWLRPLAHKDLTLAAAVLNLNKTADFRTHQKNCYSWVSLEDVPTQIQRIIHCLEQATTARVDVLVFPEVSIPVEAVEFIADYAENHRWPRIIVGGVVHQPASGAGYINECITWSIGRQTKQQKRSPYVDGQAGLTEWLSDPGDVPARILPGGAGWNFASVICFDFLDDNGKVLDALAASGVNLVAVPALSSKTDIFHQKSQILKSANQTFATVSNACPEQNPKGYACHAAQFDAPIDGFRGIHHTWPENAQPPLLLCWTLSKFSTPPA